MNDYFIIHIGDDVFEFEFPEDFNAKTHAEAYRWYNQCRMEAINKASVYFDEYVEQR
jgi:hypothetical protein